MIRLTVFMLPLVCSVLIGCANPQTIKGTVVNRQGKPEPHSIIRAHWNRQLSKAQERVILISQFTDEHGRFVLDDPEVPDFIEAESCDVKRYGVLRHVARTGNLVVVR